MLALHCPDSWDCLKLKESLSNLTFTGCGRWRYFSKDLSQGDEDATCKWCEAGSYCDSKSFHVPENALDSSLQYGVNTCQNGLTTKAAKSDESKCSECTVDCVRRKLHASQHVSHTSVLAVYCAKIFTRDFRCPVALHRSWHSYWLHCIVKLSLAVKKGRQCH